MRRVRWCGESGWIIAIAKGFEILCERGRKAYQ
jgi:hypothetical protein